MIGSKNKRRMKRVAAVLSVGVVLSAFTFIQDELFEIGKNLEVFSALYKQISLRYVEKVDAQALMRTGIDAMLDELDPYTEFIPEAELEDFRLKYVNTQYSGLGARVLTTAEGQIKIAEIFEGYAAHKAGLHVGDEIFRINDELITGMDVAAISHLLKGEEGTMVNMQIKDSRDTVLRNITVRRDKIVQPNVSYAKRLGGNIGYIKLDKFLTGAADEVKKTITVMQRENLLNGLILDLRDNGGGILQESVKIVNLFVGQGEEVVTQKGNKQDHVFSYVTSQSPIAPDLPLAILVNENSASASEIVAGALQDMDRAVIIGRRSFGKGLVQQTYRLPYNNLVKVTVAKYYTPSGRCIQALDYAHKDSIGKALRVEDSLIAEFTTKKGRKVYDGNGISPDIDVSSDEMRSIVQELSKDLLIADYATMYFNKHARINGPSDFHLSDSDYDEFLNYLTSTNFKYISRSEQLIDHLKLLLDEEGVMKDVDKEIAALSAKMQANRNQELQRYRKDIKMQLEKEIVSRYYFERGKYDFSSNRDEVILKAQHLLKPENNLVYKDILSGKGVYHIIGKPDIHFASSP